MLTDPGRDYRIAAGDGIEPLDEMLDLDRSIRVLLVGERKLLLPLSDLSEPFLSRRCLGRVAPGRGGR